MNRAFLLAIVLVLGLGTAASVAYAAGPGGKSGFMTFNSFDLIGVPVNNPQGRFLGLVNGILIDSKGEAFALVNHGDSDLYGAGGVNTLVPIAALRISETKLGKDRIVLNTDTEHMDFAPYYDPAQIDNPQYTANIDRYFGIQPSWSK
jgi:hypothetical protein